MRLTVAFLTLVGCTMAGVYKTQVLKVESPRLRMMREGTWAKFVEERNAIRIAMGNVVPQAVNDFTDVQYLGNVTLGTPEQAFTVVLDTGSANLWIPDSSCNNLACKNKRKYKASESSTYKKNGHPWSIQYGTGAAQGILGEETVRFGDQGTEQLVVPECGFGQASHLAPFFTHMEGIKAGYYSNKNGWEVMSDTGTSFIGAPNPILRGIAEAFMARHDHRSDVYLVPCDADLSLDLVIGGKSYTIKGRNLAVHAVKGNDEICVLPFFGKDSMGFGPQWLLGDPFIRQYCNIHDFEKKQIGFAESKQQD
ncbi:eukaryotic aspartyl protease [Necator americanus]|uniref:Eukaryotic aspartyl protease n=1 Tax=Necator americanus TaxID=51031 RepID=W2TT80_NECAM|nr:eukaryotic aspartyl protease [Necator americanus]ETN85270.1 eukaryotic aspartyl protease [Necator americanus]